MRWPVPLRWSAYPDQDLGPALTADQPADRGSAVGYFGEMCAGTGGVSGGDGVEQDGRQCFPTPQMFAASVSAGGQHQDCGLVFFGGRSGVGVGGRELPADFDLFVFGWGDQ